MPTCGGWTRAGRSRARRAGVPHRRRPRRECAAIPAAPARQAGSRGLSAAAAGGRPGPLRRRAGRGRRGDRSRRRRRRARARRDRVRRAARARRHRATAGRRCSPRATWPTPGSPPSATSTPRCAARPASCRERFSVGRQTAAPMETRGLLAEWDARAGRLTVWGMTKVPYFNRRTLAAMLGLDEARIDFAESDVGGGFGARGEFYPEDFLIPYLARRLARPVKWIEDRREHFLDDQSLARAAVVGRRGGRRARTPPGPRRLPGQRDGRLPPHARRLGGVAHRVVPAGPVPVAELPLPGLLRHDQQDADRHRPRARLLRGHLRARADHRSAGGPRGARSGRDAPPQSRPARTISPTR